MKSIIKVFIIIFMVVQTIMLSSCKGKENIDLNDYRISTNYVIQHNGKDIDMLDDVNDFAEFDIKITYNSNVPFILDIGLIDNYVQKEFEIKDKSGYLKDNVFSVELPSTNDEFKEALFKIKVNGINHEKHDLLFFIKNNKKINNKSIRGYDFLRLSINTDKKPNINLGAPLYLIPHTQENSFLELDPHIENGKEKINYKLQFNIDKIYNSEQFVSEYENNANAIDFVVLIMEDNKLLRINSTNRFLYGKSTINKNGYIEFSSSAKKTDNLVVILIPYPMLNLKSAERYQKIAYNSVCYYYYKFDETLELIPEVKK